MRRARLLTEATELVIRTMRLRPPQARALEKVRDLLLLLPRPLSECSPEETGDSFRSVAGWDHRAHPRFTLDLATGVGKTRLAGAVMALLWLTKEAKTFLVLAPRRAVLRRLNDAMDPAFREYIFVDPKLVPEPVLVREDEIDGPVALEQQLELYERGPRIYLLSPQLIATSRRFSGRAEFAEFSAADALRARRDVVVISDEAHHFGKGVDGETPAWTAAVDALRPALEFGLTATVRADGESTVLYRYPLQSAISDGYTKKVQILVRHVTEDHGSAEDLDHITVDFALKRLKAKDAAARAIDRPPFPSVKPVALIFAADTEHAEILNDWLMKTGRATKEQVLVVHSKRSETEEQLERLLSIEQVTNPVRIVINVAKLTEGWDVTNVYVIAPLRAMATFTNAVQAMGRGLRLPAGRRVGEKEVDTLDLLCFGRETLQQIAERATSWSGLTNAGGIQVKLPAQAETRMAKVSIPCQRELDLEIADLELLHREVEIALDPRALERVTETVVGLVELSAVYQRLGVAGALGFEREQFVRAATYRTIKQMPGHLSDVQHYEPVRRLVEDWLDSVAPGKEQVTFDPAEVGERIGRLLDKSVEQSAASYADTGRRKTVSFSSFDAAIEVQVKEGGTVPPIVDVSELPAFDGVHFEVGQPYAGWKSSVHPAYTFDSVHEALFARMLDQSDLVALWVRNQPRRLRIETPVGPYHPDFVVLLKEPYEGVWLFEIKGDIYWEAPEGEARLKANATDAWCRVQTDTVERRWKYMVLLESEIERDSSLDESLSRLSLQRTGDLH